MKLNFWNMVVSGACALIGCEGCGGDVVVGEPGTGGAGGQSSSTASPGSSGSGAGGDDECFPCARMLDDAGFDASKLCPDSVALHAALFSCVCEGGSCPTECDGPYFCSGFFMSGLCSPCAEQVCPAEMAACLDDQYRPD